MGRRVKPESERAPVQRYEFSSWLERLNRVFPPRGGFIEPLSVDWRNARRGRLTASKRAEIIYNRRPTEWNALIDELNHELSDDYQWEELDAPALRWGREHEKEAIANIELDGGFEMTDPGLVFDSEHPWIAATPDGWYKYDHKYQMILTTVQIKCPYYTKNHLATLYEKTLRPTYFYQVQWEAMVSRAQHIEFYSYDPRQPLLTRLVKIDVPVNKEVVDRLRANAVEFAKLFCSGEKLAIGEIHAEDVVWG